MGAKISKVTYLIGLYIIISASFMRQVLALIQGRIGERGVEFFLGLIPAIVGLAFLILAIKKGLSWKRILVLVVGLTLGFLLTWRIEIPVEKTHILEYAVLGWFCARDLISSRERAKGIILGCLFTISVGILDELFQAILPYRVCDLRDILFNGAGGAWGIILYSICRP